MPTEKPPFHNPFAALGGLHRLDAGPTQPPSVAPGVPPAPARPVPRAVVRFERAGRGGKAVTVIEHLEVRDRNAWLKSLKSVLGCGGSLEGERLVLQGDHRERLRTLLADRGVKKITVA